MGEFRPIARQLPYLGGDLLWLIFVRADPKTATRCRELSTRWRFLLRSDLFMQENFNKNIVNHRTVVFGVGSPPNDDVSQWFVQADVHNGRQDLFRVPHEINHYGSYTAVGSDKGIMCMRCSMGGYNSTLLIWNPLKRTHR
ncbi:hypothetical protein PIB30_069920 [Stylosanthes scabra]|uniref:F-box/kelch-repeat protein n=1 Tax=Stylosanthes scabra TaxID=79078 RepID=A0ABU6QNX1_9FABA|nr:hypothetical protein [Stylosanthes scabra]